MAIKEIAPAILLLCCCFSLGVVFRLGGLELSQAVDIRLPVARLHIALGLLSGVIAHFLVPFLRVKRIRFTLVVFSVNDSLFLSIDFCGCVCGGDFVLSG